MINLFDYYHQMSWDLHFSLLCAGYTHPTIVLNDDGFLPDDVTSPYAFFLGMDEKTNHPRYFNQLPVPKCWEIKGTNVDASVYDHERKKAHIHYAQPNHRRFIKEVDWMDDFGNVCFKDCYNKQGYRYAQKRIDHGSVVSVSYFNTSNEEIIVENVVTGDILLRTDSGIRVFTSKTDFVCYYLKVAGFKLDRIFYNSLSTPLFVALALQDQDRDDVLFWQEDISRDIPGNMTVLLNHQSSRIQIMVQSKNVYDKMLPLLTESEKRKVAFLGLMYPFHTSQMSTMEALILTNSDQLEHIEYILESLPHLKVHIGALTEMSDKLMQLSRYPQVTLYPNISINQVYQLFESCRIYLDINHFNEILNATRTAFEWQHLIVSFDSVVHNVKYVAKEMLFESTQVEQLVDRLQLCLEQPEVFNKWLLAQRIHADVSTKELYQEALTL